VESTPNSGARQIERVWRERVRTRRMRMRELDGQKKALPAGEVVESAAFWWFEVRW
jgi:hypothetical protein